MSVRHCEISSHIKSFNRASPFFRYSRLQISPPLPSRLLPSPPASKTKANAAENKSAISQSETLNSSSSRTDSAIGLMASGSSRRSSGGPRGFDFGTDDVLCSYDDFSTQDSDPKRAEPSMRGNSRDFQEVRMGKSLIDANNPQEEPGYQDVISTVEKTMKKYTDTLMRFLEGISGRLSQLELYCYSLERTIGELRSDLGRDHNESDQKLKSLEKHIQEVHRSVQILRDKQELADTQKELAKLQLKQKESGTAQHPHHNEDKAALSASEPNKSESSSEAQNLQLSLALPRQSAIPVQQPTPPSLPLQQTTQGPNQPAAYYPQQNQVPHQVPPQTSQVHPDPRTQPELQYANQRPQVLDPARQAHQSLPPVNQPVAPHYPSYQQQWPQQQQPAPQAPSRPQTPPAYPPPYPPQPANPLPESFPSSMPMQVPFSNQLGTGRSESGAYGYGAPGRTAPPPAHHHNLGRQPQTQPQTGQVTFGAHVGEGGYPSTGPHPSQSNIHGYMMYETSGAPPSHPSHYAQGGTYLQQPPASSLGGARPASPHMMRNHPYSELVEKAVNMGYAREQVTNALHRIEESGQPLDFNSLLDRLNAVPQRAW